MSRPGGVGVVTHLCLILILCLAITPTTLGAKIIPKLGDLCCFEDWETSVGAFQAVIKIGDTESGKYKEELERWSNSYQEMQGGTPQGVCGGALNFVCNKASEKCECPDFAPLNYLPTKDGRCVGDKEASCNGDVNAPMPCRKGYKCVPRPKSKDKLERCEVDPNAPKGAGDDEIDTEFRSGGDGNTTEKNNGHKEFPLIWLLLIGFVVIITLNVGEIPQY